MSRAQDRSSGLPSEAQAAGNASGATSTGSASGAGTSGPATGTSTTTTGATTTGATTTGATTGMAERSGGQMSSGSRRPAGTEPTTGYRETPATYQRVTGTVMGGSLSVLAGLLAFLGGLAVVVRPHFYPTVSGYAYAWNGRGWGWILLVLGVLLFAAGASVLLGISAARPVGVGLAVLTAIAGFLFLVYSPVWGIVIVALSVFAIWGLLHDTEASGSV